MQHISIDKKIKRRIKIKATISFVVVILLLLILFFSAINIGSIKIGFIRLLRGLFIEYDEKVSTIYDLRFPRIIISIIAGAGIAVSGVLFQSVLKNPLADPGIIGISSGASFFAILITAFFPQLYALSPIFACLGGVIAFVLVYTLSWKEGLSPIRIVLVGVAVGTMFIGLSQALNFATGSTMSGVASIVNGNISMKTWDDVSILFPYVFIGLICSMFFASTCNLMFLDDKTIRSLGVDVNKKRIVISIIACVLASCSTAIVGAISFLGLIIPHIARILVGTDHKKLIPFAMIFGSFTLLLADTIGRTIAFPHEIPAYIIMSIVGGPFFIMLLRGNKKYAKNQR